MYSAKQAYNIKSHALSPDYLDREVELFGLRVVSNPKRYILLRDPRDTAISFFEFFLARNQGQVKQENFLDLDWFLAFSRGTAKVDLRNNFLTPTSVEQAYKEFTTNWVNREKSGGGEPEWQINDDDRNLQLLRYEDFVTGRKSMVEFMSAENLLLPRLNPDRIQALDNIELFSQYSSSQRPRGQAFTFRNKDVAKMYAPLIKSVEDKLGDVITSFGYQ